MKKLKNILLIFIAIFSITLICSCEKNDDKQNTNDKEENEKTNQVKIYEFAKSNGYTGSYKDWVNSITNNGIELIVESNSIKWKYKNEGNWINLVSLLDLIENKDEKIVFSSNSTHILYRYASDITWNNLLALEDLGFNYSTNITNAGQTAYDIAVELGFVGTVEDWILSLRSDNVLSAYEIYKKYYPEYKGTEEDWINELASGSLISNENKTTVTFKDGDTVIKTEEYSYGELINAPEELEKDNYKFLGWTYEGYDWNFDLFYVGKGIELQAKWAKVHTISFTTGTTQVINNINVIDGESFTIPDIEDNKGYLFLGWSYDSQYFDIGKSYVASSDMNIVANWAKVSNVVGSTYGKAPDDIVYDALSNDRLDVYVSYNGDSGITWRDTQAFVNPVDGKTYNRGDLLPTWRAFAEKTKTKIYEACNYMATSNNDIWTQIINNNNNMMSEVDNSQAIDLLYTSTSNLKSGKFVNLLADDGTGNKYIDYMPNFKKWWNENKAIHNEVLYNGGLYYTPYAEGYNEIERTFNMDTDMVQKVLDCSNFDLFDTTINGGLMAASNVLQSGKYTPFINADYNYPDEKTKVTILVDNKAKDIYINRTTNIIKQQNELLANGCTGKQLAEQFAAYIDTAFKDLIGVNKIYETRSEIFISEKAAYNADELIALMRVIKANPGVITGDIHNEIEILFPRGEAANRVESIQSFAQIWGVHGLNSRFDMTYFSPNKKLASAKTTKGTYDALKYLSALYDEGLILNNFYYCDGTKKDTSYLDKYFKKTVIDYGYGFLTYDSPYVVSNANDEINGFGTKPSSRKISNYVEQGIRPVLPPLSYWATESNWSVDQDLTNHTGKALLRFVESNKKLNSTSWGIPKTSDNIPAALRLMDYLYSEKGSMINCFGPEEYWAKPTQDDIDNDKAILINNATLNDVLVSYDLIGENVKSPILSKDTKSILSNGSNYWLSMRWYLGANHGIGHIRHKGLNIQSLNEYAHKGLSGLYAACEAGVVIQGKLDKYSDYTWDTTVPVVGSSYVDANNVCVGLTEFWKQANCWSATPQGWVKIVVSGYNTDLSSIAVSKYNSVEYTYNDVKNQMDAYNKRYLYTYAYALGSSGRYVPSYAIATA